METKQIAARLAELCKNNDFITAQEELYSDNVISVEPQASPDYEKETKGKEAVLAKIKKFMDSVEESYGTEISALLITANAFAFTMTMDIKMKGKDRMKMDEICVYEVKDGKVISERFFM